jgi:L-amino acid N-acyltransferase YncA
VNIRDATAQDAATLAAIYGHHVLTGVGTFEEVPPDAAEMERRRARVGELGLPYVVAEAAGQVLGLAYAAPFRLRAAYRYSVEDSVYVAPEAVRRGIGRLLLAEVLARCEALGVRQVIAVIGDSGNAGSRGLHAALGFEPAGVAPGMGWKHGRWVDVVFMRKSLNGGDRTPPDGPGLSL